MVAWEIFGASEIGPGHIRAGLPNQDAFASKRTPRYDCMVVSDGVGSAAMSDVGSKMVCEAVFEAVESMSSENRTFDAALFVMEVKESFLRKIEPMTPQECSATCLFAINYAGNLSLGMLGDGLVAIQDVDGELKILRDDKAESFSNLVSSFAADTKPEDWKTLVLPEASCRAVVLCTDGVGDDLMDVEGFMNGFIDEYAKKSVPEAICEIHSMLHNWPTPKHSDDKTIACMLRKEASHGGH